MSKIDLTWGDPAFLHDYLRSTKKIIIRADEGLEYFKKGSDELRQIIRELHRQNKNVKDIENYHIVLGNGATQLLSAAIHSLPGQTVGAFSPYYMRFPNIADTTGKTWINSPTTDILIATVPNNPDGTHAAKSIVNQNTIFDLCYNWSIYTDSVWEADGDILIYNLSKSVGHAGTRIGWALVRNAALAHKMQDFIEHASCGVSYEAQERALAILKLTIRRKNNIILKGRKELKKRWKELKATGAPIVNNEGMFAWSDNRAWWEALDVETVAGNDFGEDAKYGRINIGCSRQKFDELLRRINDYNRSSIK